jgi:hypothetical protein
MEFLDGMTLKNYIQGRPLSLNETLELGIHQQGIKLEPVLQGISDFLDDRAEIVEAVRQDLERGLKKPVGYALLVTLKHLLKRAGSEYSPARALKRLAEVYSVDIVLPTIEGREIFLRRITKLDEEQRRIFHELGLQIPERLEPIQIQKCSADSAIA